MVQKLCWRLEDLNACYSRRQLQGVAPEFPNERASFPDRRGGAYNRTEAISLSNRTQFCVKKSPDRGANVPQLESYSPLPPLAPIGSEN